MNALMTISVRVASAQALAELRAIEAQSRRTARGGIGYLSTQAGLGTAALTKYGSQAQWAGRQLTYNFGLPLIAAGTAAATWALENEKAMTRVAKVYGDGSAKMDAWAENELPALERAFEALSNQFGIHQAEVIQIAGDWAAAGASGVNLAKIVKTTLETMVLGEINAAEATKNLIAIQAQYGLSTQQLSKTIEILNMTENTTGTTMVDLMNAMSRSAGTAREAGMSIKELVAITAALVPATGSAATAGNGLRTIISRLLAPTEDAADLLRRMNIEIGQSSWENLNATQRLETLARGYEELSDKQKNVVATYVASRYQLNRFQTLMRAMTNENSYYNKSLAATAKSQDLFTQKQKELDRIMKSNPQQLQQQWVILQNAMADVIQPMLPYLVYIAKQLAAMAQGFANLDLATQKWIIAGLGAVVAFGLLLRLGGAFIVLFGYLARTVHLVTGAFALLLRVAIWPFATALGLLGGAVATSVTAVFGGLSTAILGFSSVLGGVIGSASMAAIRFLTLERVLLGLIAVYGAMGRAMGMLGGLSRAIGAMFAANLGGTFIATLVRMRIALYVWMAMTSTRLQAWVLLMGARMSLLAVWIREAAAAFWFFATVPGAITGRLLAIWAVVTRNMVILYAAALRGMTALNLIFMRGVAMMGAGIAAVFARIGPMIVAGLATIVTQGIPIFMVMMARVGGVLATLGRIIGVALTGPIGIAVLVALGIIYTFRDQIQETWNNLVDYFQGSSGAIASAFAPLGNFFAELGNTIMDAFWALPEGVRNAMIAVLTVVRDVALQIYEWMSYLNPFVRHSPSLVESVTKGMDVIVDQYARAKGLGGVFASAARHLAAFKKVAAASGQGEFSDQRADVKKFMPSGLGLFDALVGDLGKLRPIMARQEAAVNAQQAVVDRWKSRLDEANLSLDRQANRLDRLRNRLQAMQDVYDAHEQAMQDYASAPIKGMGEFNDRLFENEMAQKRLQIQMAKWKAANGDIDGMSDRLNKLYGDIEMLRGEANSLRMAGAGSDVLGPIEDQIRAMEAQARATAGAIENAPVNEMQKQLEELQRQGELMQLQYDVKFDPMTRQIEELANAQKELEFDDIVAGIRREQAAMDELQPRIDRMTSAVEAQQAVVDRHTTARDALQARYDREQGQLDRLNDRYQKTADLVREIESALNDMGMAAGDAGRKAAKGAGKKPAEISNALQSFEAGTGANFPEVGGAAAIQRLTNGDETELINQFVSDTNAELARTIGKFDMFAPIRKKWDQAWAWINENIAPVVDLVVGGVKDAVAAIGNPFSGMGDSKAGKVFGDIGDVFADAGRTIMKWGGAIWRLFKDDLKGIWKAFVDGLVRAWNVLGPELEKFGPVLADLGKAFKGLWRIIKPPIMAIVGIFLYVFKILASVVKEILPPILNFIIDRIKGFIKIVRGVLEIFVGIFTGNWSMLWQGIKDVVAGIVGPIISLIKNSFNIVVNIIEGVVKGIWGFFHWLWDELVGHSIVPDIVNGIIDIFGWLVSLVKWIWNSVLKPIYNRFVDLWQLVKAALKMWWNGIKAIWSTLKAVAGWLWDNVLKPIFNRVKSLWDNYVAPALKFWWQGIKNIWNILKGVAGWLWDNVLKPVLTRVKSLWQDHVRPALGDWWAGIKNVWDRLKDLGGWIWDNVMKPVIDAFKDGWNTIKDWFQNNAGIILNPIKSVVRGIVSAINWIIKGLNKLDALPGISLSISTITLPQEFAAGGIPSRRVNGGFRTSGARAIVGEGKANYPEYVIPTDPTYRSRAQMLLTQASNKLGMQAIPMHADGGILGSIGDIADSIGNGVMDLGDAAWDKVQDLGRNAVSKTMTPFFALADKVANSIDWQVGEDAAKGAIDVARKWVAGAQKEYADQFQSEAAANMPSGGDTYVPDPSNPTGRAVWRGGVFSNKFIAHMQKAEQMAGQVVHVMQGGFRPQTSYSGTSHQGDAVDMQVSSALITAFRRVGIAAGDRTGLGNWAPHVHAVPGPGAGYAAGSAVWQFQDYMARGGMNQSHSSPWGLAEGGIVRRKAGGTLITAGEGGNDEAVVPLPHNWRSTAFQFGDSDGKTTVIEINGDLSFPNIENGDDAKAFIENLKILAKD